MGTQIRLKWINHQSNLLTTFQQYLLGERFVDVTICCDDMSLKAHKLVLSSSSTYFEKYFLEHEPQDSMFSIKGAKFEEMKAILDFIYNGEVDVFSHSLMNILRIAQNLKIRGLMEVAEDMNLTIFPQDYSDTNSYIVPEILSPSNVEEIEAVTPVNIFPVCKENDAKDTESGVESVQCDVSEMSMMDVRESANDSEVEFKTYALKLRKRGRKRKQIVSANVTNRDRSSRKNVAQNLREREDSFDDGTISEISVCVEPVSVSPLNENNSVPRCENLIDSNVDTSVVKPEMEIDDEPEYIIQNSENSLSFLDSNNKTRDGEELMPQRGASNENDISVHFANALAACGPTNFSLDETDASEFWDEGGNDGYGYRRRDGKFECELCKKTFISKNNLAFHLKTHAGKKPFKRKTTKMSKRIYNSWKQEEMDEALSKLRNGDIGFNEAHKQYKIPKPTLRRHLRGLNKQVKAGRPKDLTDKMEKELVKHVLTLESCFFGLTATDLRKLAFQMAEKYKLPHRFNSEKRIAGKKWYFKFMKDNPSLSLRTPEATSMARATGFNKERIYNFFDKYKEILDEYEFAANQIYNVGETDLSTVHKPSKIIAQKGKHQVGALTSGERGLTTTCVCCMNAAGEFIPPLVIFKCTHMNDCLKKGAPPGTVFACSKNGWITAEIFVQWLEHFIKYIRLEKSEKKKVLILLDGHTTHTKNIDAILLAQEYGIILLSFPAYTTHCLQPLDSSFFKSLKTHYNDTSSVWLRTNPGNLIKQTILSELLGIAYSKSVRMDIALSGFKATGLWPCNKYVFRDEDYSVSMGENSLCTEPTQAVTLGTETPPIDTLPQDSIATSSTPIQVATLGIENHPLDTLTGDLFKRKLQIMKIEKK